MSISRLKVGYARARRALRVRGLQATARESIRYVRTWRARQRWAERDQAFDRQHGVDTAGVGVEFAPDLCEIARRYVESFYPAAQRRRDSRWLR
jgi:hypothetical protein